MGVELWLLSFFFPCRPPLLTTTGLNLPLSHRNTSFNHNLCWPSPGYVSATRAALSYVPPSCSSPHSRIPPFPWSFSLTKFRESSAHSTSHFSFSFNSFCVCVRWFGICLFPLSLFWWHVSCYDDDVRKLYKTTPSSSTSSTFSSFSSSSFFLASGFLYWAFTFYCCRITF